MMTADVASESADIARYGEIWEDLYRSRANEPSTSFEWTAALAQNHLEAGDRFFLLRVVRGRDVICLVPLVARPMALFGTKVVTLFPIAERYNTHSDLLAAELGDDTVDAFVRALSSLNARWDMFRMSNLLEGHPLLRYFESKSRGDRSAFRVRRGHASYFLDLPSSYTEYLGRRSAKFRSHLKRTEKRIEGEAGRIVELDQLDGFDAAYEMLLRIERASWKQAHGSAISVVERQTRFYREMCRGALVRGRLHLQFLMIGTEPVAYNLGYLRDDCYFYLKTSYAERYKPLGPSTYLRAKLIESLIARGARLFDFPAEPYEWERQWTETVRWHQTLTIYRSTLTARVLAWADRLRHWPRRDRRVEHVDPRGSKHGRGQTPEARAADVAEA